MNLDTILELIEGWQAKGFTIKCPSCKEELEVYSVDHNVECLKCGSMFQSLDLFIDKLRELN